MGVSMLLIIMPICAALVIGACFAGRHCSCFDEQCHRS